MRLFLFFSVCILFSSCFTTKVLNKYNYTPVKENVNTVALFGYNKKSELVVNFTGNYLGQAKEENYHFKIPLNDLIIEYNKSPLTDSVLVLPDRFNTARMYVLDHDFVDSTQSLLTFEIRKDRVYKGFYTGELTPMPGSVEIFSQGKDLSYAVFDKGYLMSPVVIQFKPKIPWYVKGVAYNTVSFVLQPSYNKKEGTLLLLIPAIAADAGAILVEAMLWNWAFNR